MSQATREPGQSDRDRVIATLSDQFATGALDVDEFERRVTAAHHAASHADLAALVPDHAPDSSALVPTAPRSLVPTGEGKARGAMIAILGSNRRTGPWTPARAMRVTAVLGNVELDFREALMPAGPVEVTVVGAFGNIEILVPPALPVEVEGVAILSNFDHVDRVAAAPDPDAPLLRVRGVAVFGNVEVKMRLPGESEREAGARRKRDRAASPGQRRLRD